MKTEDEQVDLPAEDDVGNSNFSTATKLLQILALYTPERPIVRLDEVKAIFRLGQSTAYRYMRELSAAGLVAPLGKGAYSLGRRIVELERVLQLSDPLLLAGKPVMNDLSHHAENRAFVLCTLHNDRVLSVHMTGPNEIELDAGPIEIWRGRGTTFSLFTGAGSQVILAFMPPHQIKSIYLKCAKEIETEGLGATWRDFRSALTIIRKQGYARTIRGASPGLCSVGVPILDDQNRVAGSLLMLSAATKMELDKSDELVAFLKIKADEIAAAFNKVEMREE
jgi:DNA-binding IclR family transcriptional regulator